MTRPVHALLAALLAVCSAGVRAQSLPLKLEPIRASEHVYCFQGEAGMASSANRACNSNASFVFTGDGVVVFDALGTPLTQDRLEQRRRDLWPDVDRDTRLVGASRWLDFADGKDLAFERGGIRSLVPFDETYQAVDWSRHASIPASEAANRSNACGTCLKMEQEALK